MDHCWSVATSRRLDPRIRPTSSAGRTASDGRPCRHGADRCRPVPRRGTKEARRSAGSCAAPGGNACTGPIPADLGCHAAGPRAQNANSSREVPSPCIQHPHATIGRHVPRRRPGRGQLALPEEAGVLPVRTTLEVDQRAGRGRRPRDCQAFHCLTPIRVPSRHRTSYFRRSLASACAFLCPDGRRTFARSGNPDAWRYPPAWHRRCWTCPLKPLSDGAAAPVGGDHDLRRTCRPNGHLHPGGRDRWLQPARRHPRRLEFTRSRSITRMSFELPRR